MSLAYLAYVAGVVLLVAALLAFLGIFHVAWPPLAGVGVILIVVGYLLGRGVSRRV